MSNLSEAKPVDLIWGAASIAKYLNMTPRQAVHLLYKEQIPAAKVGNKWVADRNELAEHFRRALGSNGCIAASGITKSSI